MNDYILKQNLSPEEQRILWELRFIVEDVEHVKIGKRYFNIYYHHLNFDYDSEVRNFLKKVHKLNIACKYLTKITNLETKYTAIFEIRIPALHLRYLSRGASQYMLTRGENKNMYLF